MPRMQKALGYTHTHKLPGATENGYRVSHSGDPHTALANGKSDDEHSQGIQKSPESSPLGASHLPLVTTCMASPRAHITTHKTDVQQTTPFSSPPFQRPNPPTGPATYPRTHSWSPTRLHPNCRSFVLSHTAVPSPGRPHGCL